MFLFATLHSLIMNCSCPGTAEHGKVAYQRMLNRCGYNVFMLDLRKYSLKLLVLVSITWFKSSDLFGFRYISINGILFAVSPALADEMHTRWFNLSEKNSRKNENVVKCLSQHTFKG